LSGLSAQETIPNARVVEVDQRRWPGALRELQVAVKPGWYRLRRFAQRWIENALRRGERFDLAHQISPLGLRYACPLSGFGIPYIVGPLAGSVPNPAGFRGELRAEALYMRLRGLDQLRFTYDSALRRGLEGASAVIGVAEYVHQLLAPHYKIGRAAIESEIGFEELPELAPRRAGLGRSTDVFKVLFVGRMVRPKGAVDLVRAIAKISDTRIHALFLGQGRGLSEYIAESIRLGVGNRCEFRGAVSRMEVEAAYRAADLFVFPSFREPSGNVVLEALSHGLPIVAANRGGPGHVVTCDSGVLLTPENPEQYASAIAESIQRAAQSPGWLAAARVAARDRAAELAHWPRKQRRIDALYEEIGSTKVRPVGSGDR
jgi:glycosyltransferase involved in cell wall biosynthesis